MSLATTSSWQRIRASLLHAEFTGIDQARRLTGAPLGAALTQAAARLDGRDLGSGHTLSASAVTVRRWWDQWLRGGKVAGAIAYGYKGTNKRAFPRALITEVLKLATAETGGRDKNSRGAHATDIRKVLEKRWRAGHALPGIGTWQQWWATEHPSFPLPSQAPDFPWSTKTILRHSGAKAIKAGGNLGAAAMEKHTWKIERDYSKLRKCELYTLDDVRLDLAALDDATGKAVTMTCYILMEVAARYIVAHVCKPDTAIHQADVDELLAHGLSVPGFGIGVGYQTHILFERGTIACSEAAQLVLEAGSEGQIKVHRTGMDGGVKWTGAARDRASGRGNGKAVIESFNGKFHNRLIWLPGQRGNNAANQPRNLGIEFAGADNPLASKGRTTAQNAERLHALNRIAEANGMPPFAALPLLYVSQVQQIVGIAIADYNNEGGHGMQGFHRVAQIESAPGVWEEEPS